MSLREQLLEMGFPDGKVDKALSATGNVSVEQAMEWLLVHQDDPDVEITVSAAGSDAQTPDDGVAADSAAALAMQARSYKCNDCGKLFKNEDEVQFHAVKSGHANFSESTEEKKPLSEEERQARAEQMQQLIRERRAKEESDERKRAIEMEKNRRAQGQDIATAKQRLQEQEMKEIVEERKRQKMQDKQAKQRVLDQIKADREAKLKEATAPTGGAAEQPAPPKPTVVEPPPKKDYSECRLQIRLLNGSTLTHTFNAKEQLAAVRLYVEIHGGSSEPFNLMTTYPKRVFSGADMDTPLSDLGLVPSAVLIVTKLVNQ